MFKSLLKKASSKAKSRSDDRRPPAPFTAPRPQTEARRPLRQHINTDPANFIDFGIARPLVPNSEWGLCEQCNVLGNFISGCVKFQQWPVGYQGEASKIKLGFLDTLLATSECRLCRLIGNALRQSFTSLPGPSDFGDGKKRRLQVIVDTQFLYLREGVFDDIALSIILWTYPGIERKLHDDSAYNEMKTFSPSVRVLSEDLHHLPVALRAGGVSQRITDGSCDVERICEPYWTCVREHGNKCEIRMHDADHEDEEFVSSIDTVEGLLMLDTVSMCVAEAPVGCRYVALSYVWGEIPFLILKRENRHVLEQPGSLENDRIPRTVREVISLTKLLGERYLWVDALCIVQDDNDLKLPQLQQMDAIYLNAVLTIVAADGTHANAGLTGFSPNSRPYRQNIEDIGGLRLASIPIPLPKKVAKMKWFSRAWTYQEFMMSKRMLLFTAEQVIYTCRVGGFHEGSARKEAEESTPAENEQQDLKSSLFPDRNIGHWLSETRFLRHDWAHFVAFRTVVQAITARQMTNEADALRSVVGILKVMTKVSQERWICGMPASYLEWALHWQPVGEMQRRGRTYDGREFPSWSWIGWKGEVKYLGPHQGTPSDIQSLVHDWQLLTPSSASPTGYSQFYLDNDDGTHAGTLTKWLPRQDPISPEDQSSADILEHQTRISAQLPLLEHGLLKFTARPATYLVETRQTIHPFQANEISHPIWRVIDPRTQHWVGTLHLGASNDHLAGIPARFAEVELIAIASTRIACETPHQKLPNGQEMKLPPFDTQAPLAKAAEGDGRNLVNVMWIIWEDQTLSGGRWEASVAKRMGVGQVHRSSWAEHATEKKMILLG